MDLNSFPQSMDKNSKSSITELLDQLVKNGRFPSHLAPIIQEFYDSYKKSVPNEPKTESIFLGFIENIAKQYENPYTFEPFHKKIQAPFDYYNFGLDLLRPLIDKKASIFEGKQYLPEIIEHLKQNHNVVFLSNHQSEADPQLISLILEQHQYTNLAEEMIIVAGERVITDLFAIPFSMGCNLLCIYSKRYIDHPPEKKMEKLLHNKKTMRLMGELLKEGGKCIYVAPSGGRDRKNEKGNIEIAPFDPASIEIFYLIAKKSKTPTFFYPMTLSTYNILPPPEKVQMELGELRIANKSPVHIAIGKVIDMKNFPGHENRDKHLRRKCRSDYIWNLVNRNYQSFPKGP